MATTRLVIRGLPKTAAESDVLKHVRSLAGALEVTDCRVLKFQGRSRRMGFLGFARESDAAAVLAKVNQTYMGTNKLELAEAVVEKGGGALPRPWSRITKQKLEKADADAEARSAKQELEDACETGRVRILNLPFDCSEDDVAALATRVGKVVDVKLLKGMAIVTYAFAPHAGIALQELANQPFKGRRIFVKPADEPNDPNAVQKVMSQFKSDEKKRVVCKKIAKSYDQRNCNLLYVSASVATEVLAKHLGVSVEDITPTDAGADGDSVAARVALSESFVVAETKKWLQMLGIPESVFIRQGNSLLTAKVVAEGGKLSKKVLFVKHLGPWVDEAELERLFARYGRLVTFAVAPTKTVAVIQYENSAAAKKAFQELALYNLKNHPLYLEYAPLSVEETLAATPATAPAPDGAVDAADPAGAAAESSTIYISNLAFATSEEAVRKVFEGDEGFVKVRLLTSRKRVKDLKTGAPKEVEQSLGSGFVVFDSNEHAAEAMKRHMNLTLDRKPIRLEYSAPKNAVVVNRKKRVIDNEEKVFTRRLIVKNLDFATTAKDLRQLFANFGTITSCRLPKRQDGRIRGFGFVEFASIAEAKQAFEGLSDVHLLGRRLVIQPTATEDE